MVRSRGIEGGGWWGLLVVFEGGTKSTIERRALRTRAAMNDCRMMSRREPTNEKSSTTVHSSHSIHSQHP